MNQSIDRQIHTVLDFWFSPDNQNAWFNSTPEIDETIRQQFEPTYQSARDGKLEHWKESPQGCLALILLFDQFPLNMYRGQAASFATEALAREISTLAIEKEFDQLLNPEEKGFLYLPFMHSENLKDQDRSVSLFTEAQLENNLRFAHHHRDIIQRFGRFPHRNAILGRNSTADEQEYLNSPGGFQG